MLKSKSKIFLYVFTLAFISTGGNTISNVFAHSFSTDETSLFLSFVDEIKVQDKLIKKFVSEDDYDKAEKHLSRISQLYTDEIRDELSEKNERIANEITETISVIDDHIIQKTAKEEIMNSIDNLDAILDESVSVRLEAVSLNNSTVHALHFAQLVNSLDSNYKHSFIIPHFLPSSETSKAMHDSANSQHKEGHKINEPTVSNNKTISDFISYETTKGLISVIKDIYNSTVKQDVTQTTSVQLDKMDDALNQLGLVVDSKLPYTEIAKLIHGIIHPNLMEIYKLNHININESKPIAGSDNTISKR